MEEGKAQRIAESPGGLDPIEVLESLPEDLRRYNQSYYQKMKAFKPITHWFIYKKPNW